MLNYESFKESVVERILEFMPSEYADYEVRVGSVKKVNRTLDCLNLIPKENKEWISTPNVYIDYMYEEFKSHGSMEKILEKIAYIIDYSFKNLKPEPISKNISELRHTLIMILINSKQNMEMLKSVPHKKFLDLSIIYKCLVPTGNGEIGSILVDYQFMKNLNLTEEEIYETAKYNTEKLLPTKIKKLDDIIGEMIDNKIEESSNLFVISNDMGVNGAINMTYEEQLHNLATNLKSNLYILPSSIHEVIAVSSEFEDINYLTELVKNVNTQEVAIEERLSYNVYCYDLKQRKISIAEKSFFTN